MLTILGSKQRFCDGLTRRDFLRVGGLGLTGLTWADLLRQRANGATAASSTPRAVIMVYLAGGPSHIDMYDLKPEAPADYRGSFKPIQTKVAGMDICELMPQQAKIADKLALVRNMRFNNPFHQPFELLTGNPEKNPTRNSAAVLRSPDIGAKVSYLRKAAGIKELVPPYVALTGRRKHYDNAGETDHMSSYPAYLGPAHDAFHSQAMDQDTKKDPYRIASNSPIGLQNLTLRPGMSRERLSDRAALLRSLDGLRRDLDNPQGSMAATEEFHAQALDMLASDKVRQAFDLGLEPAKNRERYGEWGQDYLLARRLVEAGVPIVTLNPGHSGQVGGNGSWDHHGFVAKCLGVLVPELDQALFALITDLHERGLDQNVAIVVWGEMGRSPKIDNSGGGRGHWTDAGFALLAGGGFRVGQVIGATDAQAAQPKGNAYYPRDVLATLYNFLGYPPDQTTIPDLQGRPVHLAEGARPIAEL
jgi:Protein of unknown function (DUF1501)